MEDVPSIEVKVGSANNKPTGVGDDGFPLVVAAIGYAFYGPTAFEFGSLS